MSSIKKYLDYDGLSEVANKIKERLQKVLTMPTSPSNGDVVLYIGTTTENYTNGLIYTYNGSTSSWDPILQPINLKVPISMLSGTKLTVESALQGLNTDKAEIIELTQAQYNALTPTEKMNGKTYFITDTSGGISPSSGSGGNNYSTDEQEDGTWVDGSTIYKKTFIIPSNEDTDQTISIGVNNIDRIIKYEGGMCNYSGKFRNLDGYIYNNSSQVNNNAWCAVYISNGTIYVDLFNGGFDTRSNGYGHVTVWYTKSTS